MHTEILKKDELRSLKELVSGFTGFTFTTGRENALIQVLATFSKEQNCTSPLQMERLLRSNKELMKKFTESLLEHETYFFREKESLEHLITLLQRKRAEAAPTNLPIRIWSAGCSTGEEPYSLALLLLDSSFGLNFRIVASDISQQALNHARLAQYSEWSLRSLDAERKSLYFEKGMKTYRLKVENAKQRVTFVRANLTEENQLPHEWAALDAVICRNVLLYFEQSMIAQLTKIFYDQLKPGGILLTGASDPPLIGYTDFDVEYTQTGIIYRKPAEKTFKTSAKKSQNATVTARRSQSTNAAARRSQSTNAAARRSQSAPAAASRRSLSARSSKAHLSVVKETENNSSLLRDKATKLFCDGQWSEVVSLLTPQPSTSRSLLVRSLLNLGRMEEATNIAETACESDSFDATNHLLLALVMMSERRQKDAANIIQKAIFLDRNYIVAHFLHGISSFCTGDKVQAVKSLQNVQRLLNALPSDATIPLAENETRDQFAANVQRYLSII